MASSLELKLLGPFEVRVGAQPLAPIHSRKEHWLLALLALRHGRAVERSWLAGTLWPESTESQALFNLRLTLSDLRKALDSEAKRIHAPSRHTLSLDLSGADVDLVYFDAAVASDVVADRESAVSLYRGPLLEGCSEEWILLERQAREQILLEALEKLADEALARNQTSQAIGYLRRAVGVDRLHENACCQLMRALAAHGDYAAAIQCYREFRNYLYAELNAEPAAETTALFQRLRQEGRTLARTAAPASPPIQPSPQRLPHPLTRLFGRETACEEIGALMRSARLATLTGTGGIGKTRLAIQVAQNLDADFPDGVWFVELAPISDPLRVAQAVATILEVTEGGNRPIEEALVAFLESRHSLLILDNCEHLLAECARLADRLLRACPNLRLLATSRQSLGLIGEVNWRVPSLEFPSLQGETEKDANLLLEYPAVRLFVERAQQADINFRLSAPHVSEVMRICARLDGIPLAIELAAARVKVLSLVQIARRLEKDISLLAGGSRVALPRQQTLRATLDWSFRLLSASERNLLHRLAIFAGGWTLEAAEAVCSDREEPMGIGIDRLAIQAEQILELLSGLVDRSLVTMHEELGAARYGLLEPIRQYAWELLEASGERERLQTQHLAFFVAWADPATPPLWASDDEAHTRGERLEGEHANIRQALNWSLDRPDRMETGLLLLRNTRELWHTRNHFREGYRWHTALLAQSGAVAPLLYAHTQNSAGWLASWIEEYEAALNHFMAGKESAQRAGSLLVELFAMAGIGAMYRYLGNPDESFRELDACLDRARTTSQEVAISFALSQLAMLFRDQGEFARAQPMEEESLAISRRRNDRGRAAGNLLRLGEYALYHGDLLLARRRYEESLRLFQDGRDRLMIAAALLGLGYVALAEGEVDQAEARFRECIHLDREIDYFTDLCRALRGLGRIALQRGDLAAARRHFAESLTVWQCDRRGANLPAALEAFATLAIASAQPERAARLYGAAEARREIIRVCIWPADRRDYDRHVAIVCATLEPTTLRAAWAQGAAMTQEEAAAYALEAPDVCESGSQGRAAIHRGEA